MYSLMTYNKLPDYLKQMLYYMSRFQNCYKAKAVSQNSVSADMEYCCIDTEKMT